MDGIRNSILVEGGKIYVNNGFVKSCGEYCPLVNGDCEGTRGPDIDINGILVKEEPVSRNNGFVRNGGEYCPLSNGDCESTRGINIAKFVLWYNHDDFGNIGSIKHNNDSCSLSNSDFEGLYMIFTLKVLV